MAESICVSQCIDPAVALATESEVVSLDDVKLVCPRPASLKRVSISDEAVLGHCDSSLRQIRPGTPAIRKGKIYVEDEEEGGELDQREASPRKSHPDLHVHFPPGAEEGHTNSVLRQLRVGTPAPSRGKQISNNKWVDSSLDSGEAQRIQFDPQAEIGHSDSSIRQLRPGTPAVLRANNFNFEEEEQYVESVEVHREYNCTAQVHFSEDTTAGHTDSTLRQFRCGTPAASKRRYFEDDSMEQSTPVSGSLSVQVTQPYLDNNMQFSPEGVLSPSESTAQLSTPEYNLRCNEQLQSSNASTEEENCDMSPQNSSLLPFTRRLAFQSPQDEPRYMEGWSPQTVDNILARPGTT